MNDYDFYLRHASVHDGDWVGFSLARKGYAGVEGLAAGPYLHWRPWLLDPAYPNDPSMGSWGVWQWHMDVAALDFTAGLFALPAADGHDAADVRTDLHAYIDLPTIELMDVDGATYSVKMSAFEETLVEPYDASHPRGGWVMKVEFVET